jgi:hypothetical protein
MVARVGKVNHRRGRVWPCWRGGAGAPNYFAGRAVSWCERTQNPGQAANRENRRLTDIVAQRNLIPVIQEKTGKRSKRRAEKRSAFRRSESSGMLPVCRIVAAIGFRGGTLFFK